ncbi:MAG: Ig-like domain-containing protein, partial [Planctomycetota bacterium]|nr:Ig-like domain-containing protein [Planctomycetota bacterium]
MRQSLLRRSVSRNAHLLESLEQRCLLAADMNPWHNVTTPVDVNRDGYVSAIDALLVINEINRNGAVSLSSSGDTGPTSTFYDVNNDYYISAIDALLVINQLNENSRNPQPLPHSVPTADSYTAQQNTPLNVNEANGVLANDRDGTETITAVKLTDPTHGTLALAANGGFTYTPATNFSGADSFTYAVNNGGINSSPITVSLNVNARPQSVDDTYSTRTGVQLTVAPPQGVLANDTDADGGTLTAERLVGPPGSTQNGTLLFNPDGSFLYTPNANFRGTDSFRYVARDANGGSSMSAIVRINVVPFAQDDNFAVNAGTTLNIAAPGVLSNDLGAGVITAALDVTTSNGDLQLNSDGSFAYTPVAGFSGTDTFTYHVVDGGSDSNTATVTILINALPIAGLDAYQFTGGSTLTVDEANGLLRNDSAPDGGTLTAIVKTQPINGLLSLSANGSFTYTPNSGFSGLDSFTYAASDGTGASSDTVVRINVPSPSSTTVVFTLSTVNAAGTAITSIPVGGTFFVQVQVEDVRTVTTGVFQAFLDIFYDTRLIDVSGAPTFGSDYLNGRKADIATDGIVNEAGALAGLQELGGGPKLLMRVPVQALAAGIAVFAGDPRDLTPANDVLLFAKPTAEPISAMSFVPVSINVFQGAVPTAVNDTYDAQEDVQLNIAVGQGVLANDTNPGGLPLTATVVQNVQNGTLTLNADGSFSYLANANFHGIDTFTYTANDGTVNSNTATVTINVASVDDPPTSVNDSYTVGGVSLTVSAADGVLKNDTDLDSDPLTAQLVSQPANGILTLNADGSFVYTPRASFVGVDSFTYRAVGNGVASNSATVSLNVDDLTPSSIAGHVYTDVNNDGIRGLTEAPIAGILITLQGTTASGQSVFRTTTTAGNGSYRFDGVTRGA